MTSAQAQALASNIIENDPEKAGSLLVLLDYFFKAKGEPMGEVVVRDVKQDLYRRTAHSSASMERFISEAESDLTHLAA